MRPPNWIRNQKIRVKAGHQMEGQEGWLCDLSFITGKKGPMNGLIMWREEEELTRYIPMAFIRRIDHFHEEN